jgi:membrane-associated protease RseP (regulator of RpoE activity)
MNEQPKGNATPWIVGIVAAVVVLCGALFLCSAAGLAGYFLGRQQESQVYRDFPIVPVQPEVQPDEVLPEEFFPFQMPGGVNGALVQEVVSDSPADEAGIQSGDLITAINGQEISAEQGLAALVQSFEPGEVVKISFLRFRGPRPSQLDVAVELAENPELPGRAYLGVRAMDLFMEE